MRSEIDETPEIEMDTPRSPTCQRQKIPEKAVVAIEHPCIIKTLDKGLKSLGGPARLNQFLKSEGKSKVIGASLRPDDPLAKPLASQTVKTHNLLLKVTVPKRTGRKRKRGSSGPYEPLTGDASKSNVFTDAARVRQILRDNSMEYKVEPVGRIRETHRFRGLPDFQYAASTDPLMVHLRDTILANNFDKLKDFNIDPAMNKRAAGIGPPAIFTFENTPFTYSYRQNPAIQLVEKDGNIVAVNTRLPDKPLMQVADLDVEDVPEAPSVPLEPEESLLEDVQQTIARARRALEERPIMTKRALRNLVGTKLDSHIRAAYPYLGYSFVKGPFRDTLIRYGVDPRKNPGYGQYQSLIFQLTAMSKNREGSDEERDVEGEAATSPGSSKRSTERHLFDGKTIDTSSKVWQLCDITDPLLRKLADTENLRSTCDPRTTGWYHSGTWAKLKVIMKHKISLVMSGQPPNDSIYTELLRFPDEVTDENMPEVPHGRSKRTLPDDVSGLMSEIRGLARSRALQAKEMIRETEPVVPPEEGEFLGEDEAGEMVTDDSSDDADVVEIEDDDSGEDSEDLGSESGLEDENAEAM